MFPLLVLIAGQVTPAVQPSVIEVPQSPGLVWQSLTAGALPYLMASKDGTPLRWLAIDDGASIVSADGGKTAAFNVASPQKDVVYRVIAYSGKTEHVTLGLKITYSGVPGPAPNPLPGPTPPLPGPSPAPPNPPTPKPKPTDALFVALQAAYTVDAGAVADKTDARKNLVALYGNGAKIAQDLTLITTDDVLGRVRATSSVLADEKLPKFRKTVGDALLTVLPTSKTDPLDAVHRGALAAMFGKLADFASQVE